MHFLHIIVFVCFSLVTNKAENIFIYVLAIQLFSSMNSFFLNLFIYLFIFGCVGSLLLHVVFLLVAVCGLLTVVASLVVEHRL